MILHQFIARSQKYLAIPEIIKKNQSSDHVSLLSLFRIISFELISLSSASAGPSARGRAARSSLYPSRSAHPTAPWSDGAKSNFRSKANLKSKFKAKLKPKKANLESNLESKKANFPSQSQPRMPTSPGFLTQTLECARKHHAHGVLSAISISKA